MDRWIFEVVKNKPINYKTSKERTKGRTNLTRQTLTQKLFSYTFKLYELE